MKTRVEGEDPIQFPKLSSVCHKYDSKKSQSFKSIELTGELRVFSIPLVWIMLTGKMLEVIGVESSWRHRGKWTVLPIILAN